MNLNEETQAFAWVFLYNLMADITFKYRPGDFIKYNGKGYRVDARYHSKYGVNFYILNFGREVVREKDIVSEISHNDVVSTQYELRQVLASCDRPREHIVVKHYIITTKESVIYIDQDNWWWNEWDLCEIT